MRACTPAPVYPNRERGFNSRRGECEDSPVACAAGKRTDTMQRRRCGPLRARARSWLGSCSGPPGWPRTRRRRASPLTRCEATEEDSAPMMRAPVVEQACCPAASADPRRRKPFATSNRPQWSALHAAWQRWLEALSTEAFAPGLCRATNSFSVLGGSPPASEEPAAVPPEWAPAEGAGARSA